MARPLRIEYPGALYHVTSRGNAREDIFFDEKDRQRFLATLAHVIRDYHWICYAYCQMTNHYHLLIETREANLSRGMRQLNGVYTQALNRRHGRVGHIFQGRFKALLVEKDGYLLELCRYIVLNPVGAGMVETPDVWKWSSYRATAGLDPVPELLSSDWILAQFAPSRRKAQRLYRQFVLSGMTKESPWKEVKGSLFLGPPSFVDGIKDSLREASFEIPRRQRHAARPPLESLIARPEGATDAQLAIARDHGYTLREIGDHLALHYATVSRRVTRFHDQKAGAGKRRRARNKT